MALRSIWCRARSSKNTSASSIRTTAPHEAEIFKMEVRLRSTFDALVPRSPAPTTYNGSKRNIHHERTCQTRYMRSVTHSVSLQREGQMRITSTLHQHLHSLIASAVRLLPKRRRWSTYELKVSCDPHLYQGYHTS